MPEVTRKTIFELAAKKLRAEFEELLNIPHRGLKGQEGENLIGRDEACTVRVELPSISRRHARIVVTGREATIEDLDSRNGTKIGGRAVTRPTALREADRIPVGDAALTFHVSMTTPPKETLPNR